MQGEWEEERCVKVEDGMIVVDEELVVDRRQSVCEDKRGVEEQPREGK